MKLSFALLATAAAVSLYANAAQAAPAGKVYMTGNYNPWNISDADAGSPETAMNGAFGDAWTKVQGFTTDVFGGGNSFVYLDGGDGVGIADFLNGGGRSALESFVNAGGAVFVNAARNDSYDDLNAGFGLTLLGARFSDIGSLTADGEAAGFGANGAGSSWNGNSFSHDTVVCADGAACVGNTTEFVTGAEGTIVAGGAFGQGYLLVGGQTAPYWQTAGGSQLRTNQLAFTAALGEAVAGGGGAVPEPATWAMMIAGFGLVGAAARRRTVATA